MTDGALSFWIDALEKVSQGEDEEGISSAIASFRNQPDAAETFDQIRLMLTALAQGVRERGPTERSLNLLIDTVYDLSSTLSLQELLGMIVSRARALVGANVAWLTILDETSKRFRTVTAEGHLSPAIAEMTSHLDGGAVSLVMRSKSVFDTQDYLNDSRFEHMSDLDQVLSDEKIVSLAGFPIISGGKVQGILFVADRYSRKLSGREISVLGSFVLHTGVAMRNARAFTMLSDALDEAERTRITLTDHIHRIETSAATHDELTSLLTRGADPPVLMQHMANQIEGVVLLTDRSLRVLGKYGSPAFKGSVESGALLRGIDHINLTSAVSKSRQTGRAVVLAKKGSARCLAIALHGGTAQGKSLIVFHHNTLDAIDLRNLERSAALLAVAKLWTEKRHADKLIASSTLLQHLTMMNPPDQTTLNSVRERLGLQADQSIEMAVVCITDAVLPRQFSALRERAAQLKLLVDFTDDIYLAVGPAGTLHTLVGGLAGEQRFGGIISEPFSDITQAASHYAKIMKALRVLQQMGRFERFVEHSKVNLFAKLFEVGDAARIARYVGEILLPIDKRDPKQKTRLKQTLLCFFECQYNIARTATQMGLHINTVRQRLETLREITGGWDDPVAALELHIALRMNDIVE